MKNKVASIALLLLLVVMAAACGGDGGSTAGGGSPTPVETGAEDTGIPIGEIPPGTYTEDLGGRPLTLTLEEGWSMRVPPGPSFLELEWGEASEPFEAISLFILEDGPQEAVEVLRTSELEILDEADASVAGLSGTRLSLRVGPEVSGEGIILFNPPGATGYGLTPGYRADMVILDLEGTAFIVSIEAPEETFEELLPTGETVLESIQI